MFKNNKEKKYILHKKQDSTIQGNWSLYKLFFIGSKTKGRVQEFIDLYFIFYYLSKWKKVIKRY